MDKQTTPWHSEPYQSKLITMATIGDADGIQVAYTTPENAEIIVRAVNAHDELLELLREACDFCLDEAPDGALYHKPLGERIEKAIAKAEGK